MLCGLLTAMVMLLTSCNKDENDGGTPYVKISPTTDAIAFSADGSETYTYEIETNQPVWLANSDQDWCVVTMDAYNNKFTVTAIPNGASTAPTPAIITVSAGSENTLTITATQAAVKDYEVYVCGSYQGEDYINIACYWKDDVRTLLPAPKGARSDCRSMIIANGDIYIAGDVDNKGSYWKDGELVYLYDQNLTSAASIAVDENNEVHLCGSDYYWTNNTKVDVPTNEAKTSTFNCNAIVVSNGSVFIAGNTDSYILGNTIRQAASWNGTSSGANPLRISIPGKSTENIATCAFASNGSFYAGGYYNTDGTDFPCYWKDGTCTTLDIPQGMTENTVGGICVVGNNVYVAGTCANENGNYIACYWDNGTRKELALPSGAYNVEVTGITVAGGRICVTGQYQDDITNKINACYWINGTFTKLPKGTNENAYTTGIALVVK